MTQGYEPAVPLDEALAKLITSRCRPRSLDGVAVEQLHVLRGEWLAARLNEDFHISAPP